MGGFNDAVFSFMHFLYNFGRHAKVCHINVFVNVSKQNVCQYVNTFMFNCSPLLLRTMPSTLHERFPAWFTTLYSFLQMPARKLQQMKRSTLVQSNEVEPSLNNSSGLIARCTFVNLMTADVFTENCTKERCHEMS